MIERRARKLLDRWEGYTPEFVHKDTQFNINATVELVQEQCDERFSTDARLAFEKSLRELFSRKARAWGHALIAKADRFDAGVL